MAEPLTVGRARTRSPRAVAARQPSWRVEAAVIVGCTLAATVLSLIGNGGIFAGRFPDPDDYLRLALTANWLDGASWWDMSLPRLNPPGGLVAHWSRLTDLPIAGLILPLEPWLGRLRATYVAAGIVPPLLLVGFLYALVRLARPMLGRRLALLAAPASLFSSYVRFDFVPGHVDHHNWHLLLTALALGGLLRMVLHPADRLDAVIAALAFALGAWTGGESLPWLAAANLALCLIWVLQGRPVLGAALRFSAILWGLCLILLPLVRPPGARWGVACDGFGIYFASLPGFMCAFWAGLWALAHVARGLAGRAAAALACAALAGTALLLVFPECRAGPYSQIDPRLNAVWLDHNLEMSSARSFFGSYWQLPLMLLGPLLGAAFALVQSVRCPGRARSAWLLFATFAVTAAAIAYLHIQVLGPAELCALVPVLSLLARAERGLGRWRALVSSPTTVTAFALLVLGCIPFLAALAVSRSADGAGAAGKNAEIGSKESAGCDLAAAASVLDDPAGLGSKPRVIAAPIDLGAELLFRTRHGLLAAPFHRNAAGNLDVFDFFSATRPADARAIAVERKIGLVVFCPSAVGMWLPTPADHPTFFAQLAAGNVPAWLRPQKIPGASGVRLYEVIGPPK